ncbi:hypothetical protein LCGC14_2214950, partial [marine sediment metagenome]
ANRQRQRDTHCYVAHYSTGRHDQGVALPQ